MTVRLTLAMFAFSVSVSAATEASPAVPSPTSSPCSSVSTQLFSCKMGVKLLSICKLDAHRLEYRFGRPGQEPELLLQGSVADPATPVQVSYHDYMSGGSHYAYGNITFKNLNAEYSVEMDEQSGGSVTVSIDGKVARTLECEPGAGGFAIGDVHQLSIANPAAGR